MYSEAANRIEELLRRPSPISRPEPAPTSEVIPTPTVQPKPLAVPATIDDANPAASVTHPSTPPATSAAVPSPAPTPAQVVEDRRSRPDPAHLKEANRRHRLALKTESRQSRNGETKPISI